MTAENANNTQSASHLAATAEFFKAVRKLTTLGLVQWDVTKRGDRNIVRLNLGLEVSEETAGEATVELTVQSSTPAIHKFEAAETNEASKLYKVVHAVKQR